MVRKVGFDEGKGGGFIQALLTFVVVDTVLVLAVVASLLYLYTDILSGFGVAPHNLTSDDVTLYTVIAIAMMAICSAAVFFKTLWPALREAKNATR